MKRWLIGFSFLLLVATLRAGGPVGGGDSGGSGDWPPNGTPEGFADGIDNDSGAANSSWQLGTTGVQVTTHSVGIGVTNTSFKLQVSSAAGTNNNLFAVSTGSVDLFRINGASAVLKVPLYLQDGTPLVSTAPSVGTAQIANASVTGAKMTGDHGDVSWSGGTATVDNVAAANVAAGSLGTGVVGSSVAASAFYSANIVRTNLGLAIGTNVQAWDADLDDLADGSLTGSKVGDGVPAANIAAGTMDVDVISSSVAVDAVGIQQLSASGTPDGTTFLRGDNTWAAPSGSGDMVLASSQTVTGYKPETSTAGKLITGQLTVQSSMTVTGPLGVAGSGGGTFEFTSTTGTIANATNRNAIGIMNSSVTINNNQIVAMSTSVTVSANFKTTGTATAVGLEGSATSLKIGPSGNTSQLVLGSTFTTVLSNFKTTGTAVATNIAPVLWTDLTISSDSLAAGGTFWMLTAPSNSAITITSVVPLTYSVAASSANFSLQEKVTQNANGSQIFTGTYSTGTWNHMNPITSFADSSIAAGSSVFLVTKDGGATAGTPRALTVILYYKYGTP